MPEGDNVKITVARKRGYYLKQNSCHATSPLPKRMNSDSYGFHSIQLKLRQAAPARMI